MRPYFLMLLILAHSAWTAILQFFGELAEILRCWREPVIVPKETPAAFVLETGRVEIFHFDPRRNEFPAIPAVCFVRKLERCSGSWQDAHETFTTVSPRSVDCSEESRHLDFEYAVDELLIRQLMRLRLAGLLSFEAHLREVNFPASHLFQDGTKHFGEKSVGRGEETACDFSFVKHDAPLFQRLQGLSLQLLLQQRFILVR